MSDPWRVDHLSLPWGILVVERLATFSTDCNSSSMNDSESSSFLPSRIPRNLDENRQWVPSRLIAWQKPSSLPEKTDT